MVPVMSIADLGTIFLTGMVVGSATTLILEYKVRQFIKRKSA